MKLLQLTAFGAMLFSAMMLLGSCERSDEAKIATHHTKSGIVMSGAQVVPLSNSPALGFMDVFYISGTRTLNYKITWSGLSGNPTGLGIHGLAPAGYAAGPAITTPLQVFSTSGLGPNSSYSGSLLVDEVVVKEENLLSGLYYVNIRTAAYPAGEIRGQIIFQ